MIRSAFAALALAAGLLSLSGAPQIAVAQYYSVPCPPGYDGRSGQCIPNRNYDYAPRYGAACPPGYDGSSGRCIPNTNRPRYHGYGAACPPGYDGSSGQCIRSGEGGGHARRPHGGYEGRPGHRGGVACPRGYNAVGGQCIQNY